MAVEDLVVGDALGRRAQRVSLAHLPQEAGPGQPGEKRHLRHRQDAGREDQVPHDVADVGQPGVLDPGVRHAERGKHLEVQAEDEDRPLSQEEAGDRVPDEGGDRHDRVQEA
jgi:hypothetical protein